jgi:hypothetical protein
MRGRLGIKRLSEKPAIRRLSEDVLRRLCEGANRGGLSCGSPHEPGAHRGHVVNRHERDAGVPEVVGKGADRRVDDLVPRDYRQQLRFDQG